MKNLKDKLQGYIYKYNPEGLRIVATYSCKRNCKFCYQKTRKGNFLNEGKLENILKILNELNWTPIYITHQGGEISDFEKESFCMFKLTDEYYPQVFRKSITTNGQGSLEFYKKSKLYGITHITSSLHKNDLQLKSKLTSLKSDGFLTTRVNCFFDVDNLNNVKSVFDFCKDRNIQLTLCEDLRLTENVDFDSSQILYDNIINSSYKETKYKHQNVFVSEEDNFRFWVYKHLDHYDYNNIIVMPNGDVTMTFDDIMDCQGNE